MAKQRFVYRNDKEGKPRAVPLDQRMEYRKDETVESFEARVRSTLHHLERTEGSRFRIPGYSTRQLQAAWRTRDLQPL